MPPGVDIQFLLNVSTPTPSPYVQFIPKIRFERRSYMSRPSKPANVIELEGKSHRTKKEIRQRKKAEEELLTGEKLKESKETKANNIAHEEFLRIKRLLEKIGKNDELYGKIINRYCLLLAECIEFENKREKLYERSESLDEHMADMEFVDYIKIQLEISKQLISYDKQIQAKRKMLFDIEKENIMTIASALRSIPKKAEKKKNPVMEALSG